MTFRRAMCAVLGFLLVGCTPPAERLDARAQIETDEFNPDIVVDGPAMVENPFIGLRKTYELITYIDKKTHIATYVIEANIKTDLGGNFDIRSARDDTATALPVRPMIRRRREGNALVDIVVSEAVLRARAATGYRVQVIASDLSATDVTISPAMIAAQFEGVAEALRSPRS